MLKTIEETLFKSTLKSTSQGPSEPIRGYYAQLNLPNFDTKMDPIKFVVSYVLRLNGVRKAKRVKKIHVYEW